CAWICRNPSGRVERGHHLSRMTHGHKHTCSTRDADYTTRGLHPSPRDAVCRSQKATPMKPASGHKLPIAKGHIPERKFKPGDCPTGPSERIRRSVYGCCSGCCQKHVIAVGDPS